MTVKAYDIILSLMNTTTRPANENGDLTRLDTKEIALRIRADIKAAQKAGRINPRVKATVRYSRSGYSHSITITVVDAPFCVANPERVVWDDAPAHKHLSAHACGAPALLSDQAARLVAALEALAKPYHRDNSRPEEDYYSSNFFLDVDVSYDLRHQHADRIRSQTVAVDLFGSALVDLRKEAAC